MTTPRTHPAFEWQRTTPVDSLNLEVQEFRHRTTGARHLHLAAQDDQNVFLVAFPTVPQDSTGVAHILEHTTLCGSRRFPVRDPFFMMIRRSLNTFMNAFTASDWTAYPFATRNRKDFENLLQVYLDAVFFPNLDPLDFAQEGHRVEFAEPENPDSDLVFKGVVFNEMKGAMSSPVSNLYQKLTESLFPTVTYHHNSGGDPKHIPDLSYEQLKAFHDSHYHPSNAVFMTFGDIPADEHQGRFEELALKVFEPKALHIHVPDEQRYSAPVVVEDSYVVDPNDETDDKTHIVVGWLLGRSTDANAVFAAHLLSDVLLDNSASPLRRALETTDLGSAPSPMCGLQDSTHEMIFAAGVEGSNPEQAEAVEKLILDVLNEVAEKGVDREMVEAMLHQLELSQREISGDGYPYGLQLMMHALPPAVHGADPVEALNIDPVLEGLRERIKDPEFIKSLVRDLLLANRHRVRLTLKPDPLLGQRRQEEEKSRLAALKAAMDEAEKRAVAERAAALAARQMQEDDPEKLPRVGIDDVPRELAIPEGEEHELAAMPSTWYTRATNGLVYQEVVVELPELEPELAELLPLFTGFLPDVGSGGRDYLATQALHAAVTGGIGARASVRSAVDDTGRTRGVFVLSGKALVRNAEPLTELLLETFETARFDELNRLRELVAQERLHQEQGVTSQGHVLAMTAAASTMSPAAALSHHWHGLAGLKRLKALDDALDGKDALAEFAAKLARLRDRLIEGRRQVLLIGEGETRDSLETALRQRWKGRLPVRDLPPFTPTAIEGRVDQGWATATQVNFCAKAYPAIPVDHADAAALMVLSGFLRNNYLHRAIREQGGAYGGGAGYDGDSGAFRFYSYRDPRLAETLADFDRSVTWFLEQEHPWRLVEESILGVIGSIDKPGSPAGEAKKAFHSTLHGRTPEQRRRLRARVLEVGATDLKRAAETYLKPELAHTAVISDGATLEKNAELGLEMIRL